MKYIKTFENNKSDIIVGDTVKCINPGSTRLKKNTLYTISEIEHNNYENEIYYYLEGFPVNYRYNNFRFIKATDEEIDQNKYNL